MEKKILILGKTHFSKKFNLLIFDQDCQRNEPEKHNPNYLIREKNESSHLGHTWGTEHEHHLVPQCVFCSVWLKPLKATSKLPALSGMRQRFGSLRFRGRCQVLSCTHTSHCPTSTTGLLKKHWTNRKRWTWLLRPLLWTDKDRGECWRWGSTPTQTGQETSL